MGPRFSANYCSVFAEKTMWRHGYLFGKHLYLWMTTAWGLRYGVDRGKGGAAGARALAQ